MRSALPGGHRAASLLAAGALAAAVWTWSPGTVPPPGPPGVRVESTYARRGELLMRGLPSPTVSFHLPLASLNAAFFNRYWDVEGRQRLVLWLTLALVFALGCLIEPFALLLPSLAAALLAWSQAGRAYDAVQADVGVLLLLTAGLLVWRGRAPTWRRSVLVGLALGACLLYRSSLAFFPPLLALCEWASGRPGPRRAYWKHLAALCLLPYLFLLPWIHMNWVVHRQFIPFEHGEANDNVVTGASSLVETLESDYTPLLTEPLDTSRSGAVVAWAARTVLADPARYLSACLQRLGLVVSFQPLLFLLAAAGLWLGRARDELRPLALLASYLLGIHCLMAVNPHYFIPLWPLLSLLAASLAVAARPPRPAPAGRALRLCERAFKSLLVLMLGLCVHAAWVALAYARAAAAGPEAFESALDRQVAAAPHDAWLRAERGRRLLAEGDAQGAAADLARARAARPDSPEIGLLLAKARLFEGDPRDILAWPLLAEPGEQRSGLDLEARILKAWAHARAGRAGPAREQLRAAQEADRAARRAKEPAAIRGPATARTRAVIERQRASSDGFAQAALGVIEGRPADERLAFLAELSGSAPRSIRLLLAQARAAREAGRPALALESLARAERLAPDPGERRRIAALYREAGEPRRALEALRPAAEGPEGGAWDWLDMAESALAAGDAALGRDFLSRALARGPGPRDLRRLAFMHRDLGEHRRALDVFAPLTPPWRLDPGLWLERAELARAAGEPALALAFLARAGASPLRRAEVRVARLYRDLGEPRRALAALGAPSALAQAREPSPAERLELARLYRELGEPRSALAVLEPLTRLTPREPGLWLERAEAARAAGQPAAALEALRRQEALRPGPAERRRVASLYRELGSFPAALKTLSPLLRAFPGEAGLWIDEAECRERTGRPDLALAALGRAQRLRPSPDERNRMAGLYRGLGQARLAFALLGDPAPSAAGWTLRADSALAAGERAAALAALARAEALAPEPPQRRRISALYRGLGEPKRALDALRPLMGSAGEETGMWLDLADDAARAGSRAVALEALASARSAPTPSAGERLRLAALYWTLKENGRALEALRPLSAAGLEPADLRLLAALYRGLNKPRLALEVLRPLAERAPREAGVWLELAAAARGAGERAAALDALGKAEALGPGPGERHALALAYQDLGEFPRALGVFDGLVAGQPDSATYLGDRGLCRYLGGARERALDDLERAVKLEPRLWGSVLTLGTIYAEQGRAGDALRLYDQALALRPRGPQALLRLISRSRRELADRGLTP